MTDDEVRVAPLDDEDLVGVVIAAMRAQLIPELERLGAGEFVTAQARSCLSILGFVQRGLAERQAGRAAANRELGELGPDDAAVGELFRRRLALEISTRTAPS